MRKNRLGKLAGVLIAVSMAISAVAPVPVLADAERVVTLGADLSEEDQYRILKYFGVLGQDVRTIYVTNDEERALLSSYIPLSVIGTHTLSCAYVKPTNSGGIQVKTANLNWVTSNMIASALSTSGVRNCEVIAACPREVSGTGALTGVLKAYEYASSMVLDPNKKLVAAQEIATVSNIADVVGQTEATQLVNDIKIQIIEEGVDADDWERIQEIVDGAVANVESEMQVKLDETNDLINEMSAREALDSLAESIAAQEYKFEDVKETLERVEKNVGEMKSSLGEAASVNVNVNIENQVAGGNASAEGGNASSEGGNANANAQGGNSDADAQGGNAIADALGGNADADTVAELSEDSILLSTDDTALGDSVIIDATTEEAVTQVAEAETVPEAATGAEDADDDLFDITVTEEGSFGGDENAVIDESLNPEPTVQEDSGDDVIPEAVFEDQTVIDETPVDEFVDEPVIDETVIDETPVETYDDQAVSGDMPQEVYEEETQDGGVSEDVFDSSEEDFDGGDLADDSDFVIDDLEGDLSGDIFADETDEAFVDEGDTFPDEEEQETEEEPELPQSEPAPKLTVGSESDNTMNAFSLKLYAAGDVVPASGSVKILDENETEVSSIDLSYPESFGTIPVYDDAILGALDAAEGTELHVFTAYEGLSAGTYTIKAEIVFADNDGSGYPVTGTEKEVSKASRKVRFVSSGITPMDGFRDAYLSPGEADLQLSVPEGTVNVNAVSSNESDVAILYYDAETQVLTLDLTGSGDAVISVTYLDENDGVLGEDSLAVAAF